MADGLVGIFLSGEGVAGEEVDAFGSEAEAESVVEEEVVEFVGADEVFRFLFDVAVAVGRDEFGADWGVDDVEEASAHG